MSFMDAAPVSVIAAAIAAFISASDICLRQEAGDDRDLAALLVGELLAAALLVEVDRFLALLDHLLHQREQRAVVERLLAGAARLDVGVLDRGIDQPQRREPQLVLRLHRVLHRRR